jgi:energy-coupling factor transporter transmembrane protein EcfT
MRISITIYSLTLTLTLTQADSHPNSYLRASCSDWIKDVVNLMFPESSGWKLRLGLGFGLTLGLTLGLRMVILITLMLTLTVTIIATLTLTWLKITVNSLKWGPAVYGIFVAINKPYKGAAGEWFDCFTSRSVCGLISVRVVIVIE